MEPAITVSLLWIAFASTHIGLAAAGPRAILVRRLGERRFLLLFYGVAVATFAGLIWWYADHRHEGAVGLSLGTSRPLRWTLLAVTVAGLTFAMGALRDYPRTPMARVVPQARYACGMARITRHPFFVGMAMMSLAHALLATHLVGTAFFTALFAFSVIGIPTQDRKLMRVRGESYAAYAAATSVLPFAAIVDGRQDWIGHEIAPSLIFGLGATLGLLFLHDHLFAAHGMWVIVLTAGGALGFLRKALRHID